MCILEIGRVPQVLVFLCFFFYKKLPVSGLPFSTYSPRGWGCGGGGVLLYISIAYNMQKGGRGSR